MTKKSKTFEENVIKVSRVHSTIIQDTHTRNKA